MGSPGSYFLLLSNFFLFPFPAFFLFSLFLFSNFFYFRFSSLYFLLFSIFVLFSIFCIFVLFYFRFSFFLFSFLYLSIFFFLLFFYFSFFSLFSIFVFLFSIFLLFFVFVFFHFFFLFFLFFLFLFSFSLLFFYFSFFAFLFSFFNFSLFIFLFSIFFFFYFLFILFFRFSLFFPAFSPVSPSPGALPPPLSPRFYRVFSPLLSGSSSREGSCRRLPRLRSPFLRFPPQFPSSAPKVPLFTPKTRPRLREPETPPNRSPLGRKTPVEGRQQPRTPGRGGEVPAGRLRQRNSDKKPIRGPRPRAKKRV